MAVSIQIQQVSKSLGDQRVLQDVTLDIQEGDLFFLLGPSGCGKTTLLRTVAGFLQPDTGRISFGGQDVTAFPPEQRQAAMVFQSYALWPHLTVAQNVAFGLEMRHLAPAEIRQGVRAALDMVKMIDRSLARPNELSGGQQQRVALARALAVRPQCLLLDEPLSNLDAKLRWEMRGEIRRICKQTGVTALYVTHDQKEASSIADRLAIMEQGRVQQCGTPWEVYHRPANRAVAAFMGDVNFLPGVVRAVLAESCSVETRWGQFQVAAPLAAVTTGQAVTLGVRPEALHFCGPQAAVPNRVAGEVRETVFLGEMAQYHIRIDGAAEVEWRILEQCPHQAILPAGTSVALCFNPQDAMVLTG